nr:hypothetical protein [Tanacetum cinerariifolium]
IKLSSAYYRMSSSKFTTIALQPLCFAFVAVDEDLSPLDVKVMSNAYFVSSYASGPRSDQAHIFVTYTCYPTTIIQQELLESGDDWIMEESPALTTTSVILEEAESPKDQSESGTNKDIVSSDTDVGFRVILRNEYTIIGYKCCIFCRYDGKHTFTPRVITGRTGELCIVSLVSTVLYTCC